MENFSQISQLQNETHYLYLFTRLHYIISKKEIIISFLFVPFFKNDFFLLFKKINYPFLAVLGLCCCSDFSLVVESGGYSAAAGRRHLIVVASLAAEHRF